MLHVVQCSYAAFGSSCSPGICNYALTTKKKQPLTALGYEKTTKANNVKKSTISVNNFKTDNYNLDSILHVLPA